MKLIYIVLLLLLSSCGQKIPDYNNLGAGFYLDRSDNGTLQFVFPDSVGVLIEPISYINVNHKWIIISSANTSNNKDSTLYRLHSTNERLSKYNDSIPNLKNCSNPEVYNYGYYIIHKYPIKCYGPYTATEYQKAMKILNVPDSLRVDK